MYRTTYDAHLTGFYRFRNHIFYRRCYKLSKELGVQITVDQLIQAHTVFREQVQNYDDKPILVVGGEGHSCREVAHSYGFKKVYTPQDLLSWRPELWPFKTLSKKERGAVHVRNYTQSVLAHHLI